MAIPFISPLSFAPGHAPSFQSITVSRGGAINLPARGSPGLSITVLLVYTPLGFLHTLPFTPYLILPVSRFLGVNMAIRHGGRPYFTLLAPRLGVQRVPPVPGGGVSLPPPRLTTS